MPYKKNLMTMTAIASSLASVGVNADEALSDMIVSASRIEQTTLEAPANVSVVTGEAIEASGAVRITDALTAKVPGFYLRGATGTSSRINTSQTYSLRGQSLGRVKMMVDGLSLSDGNSGGISSLLGIDIDDVKQIEVVPGTSSALYGSDAIGGVINIITKIPTREEFNTKYVRGFGDGERNTFEASYRNRWETGLSASFNVGYEDMAGFAKSDPVVLPVGTTGTGANAVQGGQATTTVSGAPAYIVGDRGAVPSHSFLINGKVYYELDARSKFFAGYGHSESAMGYENFNSYLTRNGSALAYPAANVSIDGNKLGSIKESSFWNSSNPNRRREDRYSAGYDGKLGNDIDLKINLGYFDRDSYYVSSGTGATFSGGPGTSTNTPNTTLDGSAQIGFAAGERHYLIVGLSSNRSTLDRKVYSLSNWRNPENSRTGALNEESHGESTMTGAFLQDQFFLSDSLTLYAGGRYDYWTTHGVAKKYVGTPVGTTFSPERSAAAFSPKLAAVFRWTETLSLRSSIGKAFRAPSNYEMYATPSVSGSRLLIADPNVKPETARSWDIGIEKALPDNGTLKAAYYRSRLQDMIYRKTSAYTGSLAGITTNATTTNAGEAKVQGIELSGELPLTTGLRASASYTYTDSEITQDDSGSGLAGKRLRYVPKNMASFGLDAQWQKWRGILATTYIGEQYSNELNDDTVKDVYGGTSKYWLTHLRVSYQIDKNLKATLAINNVFDKQYYEYYQMPGRNASVELRASF